MKKRLLLLFFIPFLSFKSVSQSNNLLTDFINKNDLILRSVHKQMYHDVSCRDEAAFKRLLTAQLLAVQTASSDSQKASRYAFLVRSESAAFMKKYTKNNLDYFRITEEEQKSLDLTKPAKIETELLDNAVVNEVQSSKVTDMNVFNSFKTSIR